MKTIRLMEPGSDWRALVSAAPGDVRLREKLELGQQALGTLDAPRRWVITLEPATRANGLQTRSELAIDDDE
jgi:hypothetical protein